MLEESKQALRIKTDAFDAEINGLISAAKSDLKLSGVSEQKLNDETDPLIKRAVILYVKANFGWNNPDAERLQHSYNMLKIHLALSQEYAEVTEDAV